MMGELLLWVLPNNGYDTVPTLQDQLASFQREHPGLKVRIWVRTESSLWRRLFELRKDPKQRPRPDVIQIPSHWTSSLAQLGMLKDIGELDPALDLGGWAAALRDHCRLADTPRVFSLPWWMEIRVLYFREDTFRRIGFDPVKVLTSLDGLREACRSMVRRWKKVWGLHHPIANPNSRESVSMMDLAPFVWARGGDFFSADGSRSLLEREASLQGIQDYFELLASGWMPLRGLGGLPARDLFDGYAAMQFSGRLPGEPPKKGPFRKTAREARAELGALPYPGPGGRTLLSAHHLAVLEDTESPRESYALLRALVDGGAASSYASAIGTLPATEGGQEAALRGFPGVRGAFDRALESARMLPNLRVFGTLERIFDRSMKRLIRDVACRSYSPKTLRQEIIHASAEMDHILSLYRS